MCDDSFSLHYTLLFPTTAQLTCACVHPNVLHVSSYPSCNQGPLRKWPIKATTADTRSASLHATCTWHSSQAGNGYCSTKLESDPGGTCSATVLNFVLAVFFLVKAPWASSSSSKKGSTPLHKIRESVYLEFFVIILLKMTHMQTYPKSIFYG